MKREGMFKKRGTDSVPADVSATDPQEGARKAGEPASFAWTEPISQPTDGATGRGADDEPRVVLVGRGPSVAERLALMTPRPTTIAAGAAVLLFAITGLTLVSPSGERATAGRSDSPFGAASGKTPDANVGLTKEEFAALEGSSGDDSRDPFVGDGFQQARRTQQAKQQRAAAIKRRELAAQKAAEKRAKLAAARAPKYLGDFIYYSDYTPWERVKGTPGGWLSFDGQKTLMVESVSTSAAEVFVVSDVEVIDDGGRGYTYSYPLRRLELQPGAIVKFADYRDVQGDDVTYTLRYRGPVDNPKHKSR
jgi:hypothetical protein